MKGVVDLVIFDCDGVLVDSEPILTRAHAETLAACGYPIAPQTLLERFCGMSDAEMLRVIETEWGRPVPADYEQRVAALSDAYCEQALTAVAGIREALDAVTAKVCVASSGTPERIRKSLGLAGLLRRFEPNIFSAVEVTRGKPAPDLFLHAARAMRTGPERCVVVEDSVPGVRAAVSANMAVIGFCGGSHCPAGHEQVLHRHGATVVIADLRDLAPNLAALGLGAARQF